MRYVLGAIGYAVARPSAVLTIAFFLAGFGVGFFVERQMPFIGDGDTVCYRAR